MDSETQRLPGPTEWMMYVDFLCAFVVGDLQPTKMLLGYSALLTFRPQSTFSNWNGIVASHWRSRHRLKMLFVSSTLYNEGSLNAILGGILNFAMNSVGFSAICLNGTLALFFPEATTQTRVSKN